MIGFKLTPSGDISATAGKINLLSTVQEAVVQRLNTKLKTFTGEWFLNTTYGTPYRQQLIGKGLSIQERDALLIDLINDDPDVQRIVYFQSDYTSNNRRYSVKFEVEVEDQILRSSVASLLPSEEVEYLEPDNYALSPSCTPEQFALVSNLYPLFMQESVSVQLDDYHFDVSDVGENNTVNSESASASLDLYSFEVKSLVIDETLDTEQVSANPELYSFEITDVVQSYTDDVHSVSATPDLYSFDITAVAVNPGMDSEALDASLDLYSIYVGTP